MKKTKLPLKASLPILLLEEQKVIIIFQWIVICVYMQFVQYVSSMAFIFFKKNLKFRVS